MKNNSTTSLFSAIFLLLLFLPQTAPATGVISATAYDSLQEAIDSNPGKAIYVPTGIHEISQPLRLTEDGTSLYGHGTISQSNASADILRIQNASHIRIEGLTLTRPEGAKDTTRHGLLIEDSHFVEINGVRVIDNRSSPGAAIWTLRSDNLTIRDSTVLNYKRIAIDDRMAAEHYGYSFRVIDGHGIAVRSSHNVVLDGNRVIEENYLATEEMKDKHGLGKITEVREDPGRLASPEMLESGYASNWHQGSGIFVSHPLVSSRVIIRGNLVKDAGQGIDLHSDNVTVSNNIIDGAMIGMKTMHGARHVLIDGNQFLRCDLWAILIAPAASSHGARDAKDGEPAREQNVDGGSIISNNIVSEFGYGGQYWNWEHQRESRGSMLSAIVVGGGQLPENPPARKVLIQGNLVYDVSEDGIIEDGKVVHPGPRHKYAVFVDVDGNPPPERVLVRDNLLDAGFRGVSNIAIE